MRAVATTVIGLVVGIILGAVARGWMRLISDDPEFSWDGTLFIIGSFTVWGFAQGFVIGVRRITSRRWVVSLVRAFGIVGMMPIFSGAGAIMAPTVIFGGLALHRSEWKSVIRVLLCIVAAVPVIFAAIQIHGDLGWSWKWWLGIAGLVAIWGALTLASRETFARQLDGWRVPLPIKIASVVALMVAVALPIVGMGIA